MKLYVGWIPIIIIASIKLNKCRVIFNIMYYTGLCLALTTSGTATSDQLQLLHKLLDWPVDYIFPSEYRKVDRLLLMYQAIVCRDGTIMFSLFITITRKLQGFWDYFSKEMDVYVTIVCPS